MRGQRELRAQSRADKVEVDLRCSGKGRTALLTASWLASTRLVTLVLGRLRCEEAQ